MKVETSVPADFQEKIRHAYPRFQERPALAGTQVPAEFVGVIPAEMQQLLTQGGRHFDFSSSKGEKTVTLNKEFLSLTTTEYVGWEEFVEDFRGPLDALILTYKPDSFIRIGLRYQNIILPSEIDQRGASWSELINPQVAGILADEHVGEFVDDCRQIATIRLKGEAGFVRIQHGVGTEENRKEKVYFIDSDFYIDQPQEVGNALDILGQFNRQAGYLFRWAIDRRLHEAMGPVPRD